MKALILAITLAGGVAGCTSVPAGAGFSDVQALAQERIGARLHWIRGTPEDAEVDKKSLRDRLMRERYQIEHYLKVIIPLRERAVALMQERYNFMMAGTFELLEAKNHEFDAYHQYIEAVRDYWITRSEFIHAIGGAVSEK